MTTRILARVGRGLVSRRAILGLCATLVACASGDTDGPNGSSGNVTMSINPLPLSLFQGGTSKATVNITRTDYTGALTLSDSGLPSGVTLTFNPTVLSGSTLSSTATLTAPADATPGQYPVVVKATGADGLFGVNMLQLIVSRPQVNITRTGSGTGTVTSSPAGINCGNTCSAPFPPGTNITLTATPSAGSTFAGWSSAVCTGTNNTCSFTLSTLPTITATFNSTAQSFSVAMNPTTASVPQGGNATATANITRLNGYAGAVTFSVTGAPSGVTVAANPASATGATATLNIAAISTVAVGNYPITISATGVGITGAQTATLNVQVTPAPGGSGNVVFSFASCDPSEVPTWAAVQNGTGGWTRVTPVNNTFTFAPGARAAFALVVSDGPAFHTTVFYGSQDEITSLALGSPCGGLNASGGTKRLTGTIASIPANGSAIISIGAASTEHPALQGQGYTLDGVPAGTRDLMASSVVPNASGFPQIQRLILRRSVNYAATIPVLAFGSAEAFFPAQQGVVPTNLGSDQMAVEASFITTNGVTPYYSGTGGPNAATNGVGYIGVPDSLLQPGDLHAIVVSTVPAGDASSRAVILVHHSVVRDTVTFGPALNQPSVTSIGTTPYLRMHATLASQSAYNGAASADFDQSANSVTVIATAGYAGSTPASWTLDIPDLTGAGYDPAWGLKTGSAVDWQVTALGGGFLPALGAAPVNGDRILGAEVGSTSTSFNRFARVIPRRRMREP